MNMFGKIFTLFRSLAFEQGTASGGATPPPESTVQVTTQQVGSEIMGPQVQDVAAPDPQREERVGASNEPTPTTSVQSNVAEEDALRSLRKGEKEAAAKKKKEESAERKAAKKAKKEAERAFRKAAKEAAKRAKKEKARPVKKMRVEEQEEQEQEQQQDALRGGELAVSHYEEVSTSDSVNESHDEDLGRLVIDEVEKEDEFDNDCVERLADFRNHVYSEDEIQALRQKYVRTGTLKRNTEAGMAALSEGVTDFVDYQTKIKNYLKERRAFTDEQLDNMSFPMETVVEDGIEYPVATICYVLMPDGSHCAAYSNPYVILTPLEKHNNCNHEDFATIPYEEFKALNIDHIVEDKLTEANIEVNTQMARAQKTKKTKFYKCPFCDCRCGRQTIWHVKRHMLACPAGGPLTDAQRRATKPTLVDKVEWDKLMKIKNGRISSTTITRVN